MNIEENKLNHFKLSFYAAMLLIVILLIRSYYFYEDIKTGIILNAKEDAHLLQDYMMSMREIYHKQFLQSGLELTDSTLGFLPAHASTLISDKFLSKNKENFYIRNVSDNPRNPINMADTEEFKAIEFFKETQNQSEYFEKYSEGGKKYFQYAAPIYIKPYCLACHGKKEEALPTIRKRYNTAYDYKVGDLRGIVSIKIPQKNIQDKLYAYIKKELILAFLTFVSIAGVVVIIYRKIIFHVEKTTNTAIRYASKDPLTGLHNRHFLQNFSQCRKHQGFVVAFIDIDHFKKINDTYGHDTGDAVLKEFASFLTTLTRLEDIVCRYGGEEFLVIVYNISPDNAIEKFEKIRNEIEKKSIQFNDTTINITISLGVGIGGAEDSLSTIITYADQALYKAKMNGRNRLEVFNSEDTFS